MKMTLMATKIPPLLSFYLGTLYASMSRFRKNTTMLSFEIRLTTAYRAVPMYTHY